MAGIVSKAMSLAGIHVRNLSEYPVMSSRYLVLTNSSILGFSKVSGLTLKSTNILALNEGGTERPYLVRQQQGEHKILMLEKGFGTYEVMTAMRNMRYLMILIRDAKGAMQGAYYLDDAVIKDVTLSDLEAKSSNVLIQTMTIAYHSMKRQDKLMNFVPMIRNVVQKFADVPGGSLLSLAESYATGAGAQQRKDEQTQQKTVENIRRQNEAAKAAPAPVQGASNPDITAALEQNNQVVRNETAVSERRALQEQADTAALESLMELD